MNPTRTSRFTRYLLRMSAMTRNDSPLRWLSVAETATRLGVSGPTVRRWVHGGRLKAVQVAEQGVLRIPESELDRLAEQRERP